MSDDPVSPADAEISRATLDTTVEQASSVTDERLQAMAEKKQLHLADWVEITGIRMDEKGDERRYKITKECVRFAGWPMDMVGEAPASWQAEMLRDNDAPGLTFPCTPNELVDFVDSEAGDMFASLFVPDYFRKAVKALADTKANSAAVEQVPPAADANTATAKVNNLLTKGQMTAAFEDLHYNADQWSKYLASPPPWLVECRKAKGSKTASALWNPVEIAIALTVPKRGISVQKLDAVFVAHCFLKQWVEEWRKASDYLR